MTKSSRNKRKERRWSKTFQQGIFLITVKLNKNMMIYDLEIIPDLYCPTPIWIY